MVNSAVLGGLARTVRFIGACEAMGVGFWRYSRDAGICTAAYLHVTAAMPWITEPAQSLFRRQVGDVIEAGRSGRAAMSCAFPKAPASR